MYKEFKIIQYFHKNDSKVNKIDSFRKVCIKNNKNSVRRKRKCPRSYLDVQDKNKFAIITKLKKIYL